MATNAVPEPERHVHFASDQVSGGHRKPEEFRTKKQPLQDDRIFAIRSKVPFDAWFRDYGLRIPLANSWQVRGRALVTLGQGLGYSLVDAIQTIYAKICLNPFIFESCGQDLKDQWHGVCLSFVAIFSPEKAREDFISYWQDSRLWQQTNRLVRQLQNSCTT